MNNKKYLSSVRKTEKKFNLFVLFSCYTHLAAVRSRPDDVNNLTACEESRSSSRHTRNYHRIDEIGQLSEWARWFVDFLLSFSLSLTLPLSFTAASHHIFSVPKTWAVVQMETHSGMPLAARQYVHFATLTLPVSASAFVWCARECFYHLENTRNSIQLSTFGFFSWAATFHTFTGDGEFFFTVRFSHL